MDSHDSAPWDIEVGENDITMNVNGTQFSGTILSLERGSRILWSPRRSGTPGLWEDRSCELPMRDVNSSFPLFCSGTTGSGDLVYLSILPKGEIRFGLDEWGVGGTASDVMTPSARTSSTWSRSSSDRSPRRLRGPDRGACRRRPSPARGTA